MESSGGGGSGSEPVPKRSRLLAVAAAGSKRSLLHNKPQVIDPATVQRRPMLLDSELLTLFITWSFSLLQEKNVNFLCPICFELINEAHMTRCGHTFCYACLLRTIEQTARELQP